jgi:hypothetical protein
MLITWVTFDDFLFDLKIRKKLDSNIFLTKLVVFYPSLVKTNAFLPGIILHAKLNYAKANF